MDAVTDDIMEGTSLKNLVRRLESERRRLEGWLPVYGHRTAVLRALITSQVACEGDWGDKTAYRCWGGSVNAGCRAVLGVRPTGRGWGMGGWVGMRAKTSVYLK